MSIKTPHCDTLNGTKGQAPITELQVFKLDGKAMEWWEHAYAWLPVDLGRQPHEEMLKSSSRNCEMVIMSCNENMG